MKISRDAQKHGNILPSVCGKLSLIPSKLLFYREQRIRHPDSIYAISLDKLLYWLISVLDELDRVTVLRVKDPMKPVDMEGILWRYEVFLKAAQEHYEAHFQILKAFINPSASSSKSTFADKYVEDNRLPGARPYKESVQEYKTMLNCINHLKHNQAVLRYVGADGPPILDGFFFEEVDTSGLLGPSPIIHPDQGGFSFFRHLALHAYYVYFCSEKLLRAIEAVLQANNTAGFDTPSHTLASLYLANSWKAAIKRLSTLPRVCFPTEVAKHMVKISLSEDENALTISFPSRPDHKLPAKFMVHFRNQDRRKSLEQQTTGDLKASA
jgi:hypothetical protein